MQPENAARPGRWLSTSFDAMRQEFTLARTDPDPIKRIVGHHNEVLVEPTKIGDVSRYAARQPIISNILNVSRMIPR
jgi:hypothetical protein